MWAILSDPVNRDRRWKLDEFLATGTIEIDAVIAKARTLGHPLLWETALDFGCGVGRNTRRLASYFRSCVGVDISQRMVDSAIALNEDIPCCSFAVGDTSRLATYEDGSFDLVYSNLVLQHLPNQRLLESSIAELQRVLRRGGLLVFQLPSAIPMRYRIQPRRRLYEVLRALGVPAGTLQRQMRLYPISMRGLPQHAVLRLVSGRGGTILTVDRYVIDRYGIESRTYWITRV